MTNLWNNMKYCKRCTIILSGKSKYSTPHPKHPNYCEECGDIIDEAEEKENQFFAEKAEQAKQQSLEDAIGGVLVD